MKPLPGAPVFSLEDSHANVVLIKTVACEIKAQGRRALEAGAEQNQPQSSGCAVGLPVGNLISPPVTMAMRKTTAEERTQVLLGWMQLCWFFGERMRICVCDSWTAKSAACRLGWQ